MSEESFRLKFWNRGIELGVCGVQTEFPSLLLSRDDDEGVSSTADRALIEKVNSEDGTAILMCVLSDSYG